jgi:hypothetical protein
MDAALATPAPTLRADPLADATIARILGPHMAPDHTMQLRTIGIVNREMVQWENNGRLATWRASPAVPPAVADALHDFVAAAGVLPDWAAPAQLARAEHVFMDIGIMSCTTLFCASLPECYVVTDLAAVLHAAGQLDAHCEYRIRATAAMIFPVLMHGGLTTAAGGGIAQTIKVRLIHATIRYLILHGAVDSAVLPSVPASAPATAPGVEPSMQQQLLAHGWNTARDGLPCNQEELAYTLLTFGYVYLRALRKLGIGLPAADEQAYLHAWNVVGHVLGIERSLMPASMADAAVLFADLQERGRQHPYTPDPRPALANALMRTMQNDIPFRLLKPFPVLLTRYLCGTASSADLGLTPGRWSPGAWLSGGLFAFLMGTLRLVDATVRLVLPQFSFSRLLARIVGYRFTVRILMDQTRPLKLPEALLGDVNTVLRGWHRDPKAPDWMNRLEQRIARPVAPPDQPLGGAA